MPDTLQKKVYVEATKFLVGRRPGGQEHGGIVP